MGFDMHNRDPEVETLIDTLTDLDKAVYRSMRDDFDRITNEGADYDVEAHDKEVGMLAEVKFGIPYSQALDIYADIGMRIAQFQDERLKRSKR